MADLRQVGMSDLGKVIPSVLPPTKNKPEGNPPEKCFDCKNPFDHRIVVRDNKPLWAEICLRCKRCRSHRLQDFPTRYREIYLDSCDKHQGNSEAVKAIDEWIRADANSNLWFFGPTGTGKTHLAAAAMWEGPPRGARFVNVAMMLLDFQASVSDHQERETLRSYGNVAGYSDYSQQTFGHLMLFDDVGAHRISDFGIEMFGLLLENFYSYDNTGMIFTSNLTPRQLVDTMGSRIASRLQGLARPIKIDGKDCRLSDQVKTIGKTNA